MLVVAFVSWAVYQAVTRGFSRETAAQSAMNNLAKAIEPGRKTRTVLAGVQYARPGEETRGGSSPNSIGDSAINFDAALAKVGDSSSTDARLVRAKTLVATGTPDNVKEGLTILQGLLAEGVKSPELYNDLGAAYHAEKDYDHALEAFGEALRQNPELMQALFNHALAAIDKAKIASSRDERTQLNQQARADLEQFIKKCPNIEWTNEARHEQQELDSRQ
jgi:tetratricopeptide (TPR) repeat protein